MTTKSQILKAVGNPFVSLYRGSGYWYFVYDDYKSGGKHHLSKTVYVTKLNDMTLEQWVTEAKMLIKEVDEQC